MVFEAGFRAGAISFLLHICNASLSFPFFFFFFFAVEKETWKISRQHLHRRRPLRQSMGRNVWHGKLNVENLLKFHNVQRENVLIFLSVFVSVFAFHLLATSSSSTVANRATAATPAMYFHSLNNLLSSTTKSSKREEKYFRQKYLGYGIDRGW